MRLLSVLTALLGCIWGVVGTSDNLTDLVTWDGYSLSVNGQRVFINSAEFHYQRLPVPEMWLDVLQKIKSNGFNAVSIYFFWSYHSPNNVTYDFETAGKDIQRLFDYCKQVGLWVVARPGPYCNAETNGGGLALWGSDGSLGKLRTNDETYYNAWLPFVTKLGKIIAKNQITEGGPVIINQIENEYQETSHSPTATAVLHMEQLEAAFRAAGMIVPFSSNEKGMRSESWSVDYENVGGAVNLYGLDSYPGGLSCTNPKTGWSVVRTYYQWFQDYAWSQPEYFPEFEGGWFSAWGSTTFYDECSSEHDPAFADLYYKNNVFSSLPPWSSQRLTESQIGQKLTLQSFYMTFGGTNWGHSAAPVVYSSYDYSAPIRETRQQWPKLWATKLIAYFTRVSSDLTKTEMMGNGTGYHLSSSSGYSWVLKNPDTNATFTVIQQATTSSTSDVSFSVDLDTSAGTITVPDVELTAHQSKILVTDYSLGSNTILYSSADIAIYGVFGNTDVVVLYVKEGQTGSFAFKNSKALTYKIYGDSTISAASNKTNTAYTYTQSAGSTAVKFSNGVLAYLMDNSTAGKIWAMPTTSSPHILPKEQIFVFGPYLVRSVSLKDLALYVYGDSDESTTIEAYTGTTLTTIVWNGQPLKATKTAYGSYTAKIPGAESRKVSLPKLTNWKSADSLPELQAKYDDSKWVVCNKNTTKSPTAPSSYPVLFSSDYGYYVGTKVYRGYFDGGNYTTVYLATSGGVGFGWNAWLNGVLIGTQEGNASATSDSATLKLPASAITSVNNVVTVVVDYHGHDETSTSNGVENPRGILGAYLLPGGTGTETGFKEWKIAGNAGGNKNIDAVRGPMNEGGLYAERLGWHLPGFKPGRGWNSSAPTDGLSTSGIRFYVTDFVLNIDEDLDVPLGISFSASSGTVARVMFWINGYQYGKYVPQLGPQTVFPVPPGIINNRGSNRIAVSLWAQTDDGAMLEDVSLISYGQYQTSFNFNEDWSYLQPKWSDRSKYA